MCTIFISFKKDYLQSLDLRDFWSLVSVCVCVQSHLSCVQFFETPRTVAH